MQACKIAYESIVARMTEELNRFQKERASDMSMLLKDFAMAQAQVGGRGRRGKLPVLIAAARPAAVFQTRKTQK